jgi:8-oxo-dGTP pyrophosphatase MutT (NUDIX family)
VAACIRREVLEETGLRVQPGGCAFALEAIDPQQVDRIVDLVFLAEEIEPEASPSQVEDDLLPSFVRLEDVGALSLRPPLAGHLRALNADPRPAAAAYLGNMWRPYLGAAHNR